MTAAMAAETKPYLDAVMKMGSSFKLAHADQLSPKLQSKLLKTLAGQELPELPKNATSEQRREHEQAADQAMQGFDGAQNKAVSDGMRALREATKDIKTPAQFAAVKEAFEKQYDNLRRMAGRQEPSALEMALPEDSPLRTKLDPLTGGLRDPSTGLYANMTTIGEGPEQKNVIMFGGTGVGGAKHAQLVVDAGQFMGGLPKSYQQAAQLVGEVKAELLKTDPNSKLETAGHSLGGGLAHYAALSTGGVKATCFNAAALAGGAKAALGDKLATAKEQVLHVNVRGDLVGDGIGQARIPVQKAFDTANKAIGAVQQKAQDATAFVADKADRAKQIGQMGIDVAKDRLAPAADFVADKADSAKQIGQMGIDAAKDRLAPAANFVADKADSAKQIGQMGIDATKDRLAPAAEFVAEKADGAKQTLKNAGTSVRDSLRGIVSGANRQLNDVKQQVKESAVGKKAGEFKNSAVELKDDAVKLAQRAKEVAITQYENLGIARGGLAIPHQYGSCVTMDNNGRGLEKNNPLKNHVTGALNKAYTQNEQRLAQAAPGQQVRQNIQIGQRGGGGQNGIGI